jgi:predicted outer membrane protein
MRRWRTFLALTLACGLLAVPATAGAHDWSSGCSGDDFGPGCTITAAEYLPAVWQANEFEIQTGQLAQQRAESTAVRDLGAMLVTDHTAFQQQVEALAGTLSITLPTTLSAEQQAWVSQLEGLSGADFDRAWLQIQWRAHKLALALTLRAAICGETPELRALAQGALPVITRHLAEVRSLLIALAGSHEGNGGRGDDGHGHGHGNCGQGRNHHRHGQGHGHAYAYGHHKACADRHHHHH